MIRELREGDIGTVTDIVNENWKRVNAGYVNPRLLAAAGCENRRTRLKEDFTSGRLSEYVWEENGRVLALLSIGDTADSDRGGAFELWRIYVEKYSQHRGIGGKLLRFAEQQAKERGYSDIVIWAFKENAGALSFYCSNGYSPEKEEYLGEPYQAFGIRLAKKI